MGEDKLKRLRRIGVAKGTRHLKPALPKESRNQQTGSIAPIPEGQLADSAGEIPALEVLFPGGRVVQTDLGGCFVLDHVYPLTYRHGQDRLEQLADLPIRDMAAFDADKRLTNMSPEDLLFLDTETTGLSGAGTIAFMVGVAFIESTGGQSVFIVRQYFLRDHGDEAAMLTLLAELLALRPALVTFNGRAFDLPLLETRYIMNRLDGLVGDLRNRPHIDLLPPSRRLWSKRLASCSLGSLETHILNLDRTSEDVPGWAIPGLYMDYLRSGDARELSRVFYHNEIDMLSMGTLVTRIMRQFSQPDRKDHPLDLLSLGRWQMVLGQEATAENILRMATSADLPLDDYHYGLHLLGSLLKRAGRRTEAVPLWEQIAVTSFEDVSAHVELAKAFEWHLDDLKVAHYWTEQALSLCESRGYPHDDQIIDDLTHRLKRLELKLLAK